MRRKGAAEAHYALDNLPNKILAAEYQTVLPDETLKNPNARAQRLSNGKCRAIATRPNGNVSRAFGLLVTSEASGGLTGVISTILNDAAELYIRNGDEFIGISHLERVAREHV